MMRRLIPCLCLAALAIVDASPAHAGGVLLGIGSWLGGLGTAIAGSATWTWLTTNVWGRLTASLVISSLQARLARRRQGPAPGQRTNVAGTGGVNPRHFGLGVYATRGTRISPPYTVTAAGVTNYWWVEVLDLSDIAGAQWLRCALEGEWVTIAPTRPPGWDEDTLTSKYFANSFVRLRTGTEGTADAWLMANVASDPTMPWASDMIGRGVVQGIFAFAYKPTVYTTTPQPLHEMQGIPLYDPRADSTAGGSGAQRWNDIATWAFSENPMVQLYNVLRGISLDQLGTWGGRIPGEDLPVTSWSQAMAKCDVSTAIPGGGSEPRFRAGLEVLVTDEPHQTVSALLDAACAEIADCGGTWKVLVAEPPLPVYFFADGDTLATAPEELDPFPASTEMINAVRPIYTDPDRLYEAVDGPLVSNSAWAIEDGQERLVELPLAACKSRSQAHRIARAELLTQRTGMLVHRVPLPPDALILEPLDTVAWTSARHGYDAKQFQVIEIEDQPETAIIVATLRAIDPSDHTASPSGFSPGSPPPAPTPPPTPGVLTGVTLSVDVRTDSSGTARHRVLTATWPGTLLDGKGVDYEVRRQGTTDVLVSGALLDATRGSVAIPFDPLPGMTYEARLRLRSVLPQDWSAWVSVAVPARRSIGSATLATLSPSKAVTNALTTWDPVISVAATDVGFSGQEGGFAKMQVSLSGASTARLLWRLIARQTPSGGSYVIFERIEELTSARSLVLSAGGSVAAPWAAFAVTLEVSGELLPAGATATITHTAIQFITPHA